MQLIDLFQTAISNKNTGFFIIDSGNYIKDDDYLSYAWHRNRNNKIKAGDVFIYRKPQKLSSTGKFFLYGVGQFSRIEGDNSAIGYIENAHHFKNIITQQDLENFEWEWKRRENSWEHYWNQYGINQITKNDFERLLSLHPESYEPITDTEVIKFDRRIAEHNYYVDDEIASVKVRPWQRSWSDKVKNSYGYQCAMCDIEHTDFLVGSHIKPVSVDKDNRTNPANGICLCVLHDRAFDRGHLTIGENGQIIFSPVLRDFSLNKQLVSLTRKKFRKPLFNMPENNFLEYHRSSIFKIK